MTLVKLLYKSPHPEFFRCPTGNDSQKTILPTNNNMPSINKVQKIPCQPKLSAILPPAIGAATGAIPFMAPIMANIFASSLPEYLSAATEREITIPPAPAIPCISRHTINIEILVE